MRHFKSRLLNNLCLTIGLTFGATVANANLIGHEAEVMHDYNGDIINTETVWVDHDIEYQGILFADHYFNIDLTENAIKFSVHGDVSTAWVGFTGPEQGYGIYGMKWSDIFGDFTHYYVTYSGIEGLSQDAITLTEDSLRLEVSDSFWAYNNDYVMVEFATVKVPEPVSMALFGVCMAGLGWSRRRKAA